MKKLFQLWIIYTVYLYCYLQNSLKTVYESLKSDLKRLEEMTKGTNSIGATVANVSNQLCQFITARIQLIDLSVYYRFKSSVSNVILVIIALQLWENVQHECKQQSYEASRIVAVYRRDSNVLFVILFSFGVNCY